jgi:galactokinase
MDQSASVLGVDGHALFISFDPQLDAQAVQFPKTTPEPTFVIANTYVTSEKRVTGPIHYNLRVVETTLAAEILAKKLSLGPLKKDAGPLGSTLKGLMDLYLSKNPEKESLPIEEKFEEMAMVTEKILSQTDGYTREEMAEILGTSVDELVEQYMTRFPVRAEKFQLRSRTLHVFGEAARVVKFYSLLQGSAGEEQADDHILVRLGELMDASQSSCKDLYDCSCDELDELCALAKGAGSYGSRLTGAGWGGCSVHLVPQDKAETVKNLWLKEYYSKKFPDMSQDKLEEAIVISKPAIGAVLYKVKA